MAKPINLTETLAHARSIDFVEQYGKGIKTLIDMLRVERTIPMAIGSTIKTYKSTVTLAGGTVDKGDIIPLSEVEQELADTIELAYKKYRKAVAVEDIQKYGFEQAIINTDSKLVREIQKGVRAELFGQLATGTGTATGVGLQGALAQGWGGVQTIFEDDGARTIAFVNPADIADYLAAAQITVQTAFGMNYVENFLGVDVVVIASSVPAKTVYATATENLVLAYAKVDSGEIAKAFDFVTDETGIIGVTHASDKSRLTAETTALTASALFAERLDGVIKVTITAAAGA